MKKIDKQEILKISVVYLFVIFGILFICQTLTSGVHLVDDHNYWNFAYQLDGGASISEVIKGTLQYDFQYRFRPLYFPLRVIQTAVFGTNLFVMSILKGAETVIACILIYWIARKMDCTKLISVAVSFFILVGPQSATWWKLGPQELTGTWIFALGILGVFWWKETQKKRYNILAIFCFFFASLYKESFIAMIPSVMMMYLYFSMKEKKVTWENLWEAIKANMLTEIILGMFLLIEAYIILFVIGTDGREYIGLNIGLWDAIKMFLNNFRLHLRVGQYGIFVFWIICLCGVDFKQVLEKVKWEFLLACVMVLPQFILYAKTGLEERYVIPWIYGVCYLFLIVIKKKNIFEGKKKLYYNIGLILLLVVNFILVFYEASYFTYRGKGITKMFETVREISTDETKIMTAFEPYEESDTSTREILIIDGIDNIYKRHDGKILKGDGAEVSYDEINVILTYNEKDRHYLYEQGLDLSDFLVTDYNTVSIAVRRETKEFDLFESKVSK